MKKILLVIVAVITLLAMIFVGYKFIESYRYPLKYRAYVEKYAAENDLSESLVFAVIHIESGFDPNARSEIEARGLMQITEDTFEWVKMRMNDKETSFDDLYDPETNIKYGSWLLKLLMDEFRNTNNVICAYYAGWGTVTKWLESEEYSPDGINVTNIPYKDTAHHLNKFNKSFKKYKQILDETE